MSQYSKRLWKKHFFPLEKSKYKWKKKLSFLDELDHFKHKMKSVILTSYPFFFFFYFDPFSYRVTQQSMVDCYLGYCYYQATREVALLFSFWRETLLVTPQSLALKRGGGSKVRPKGPQLDKPGNVLILTLKGFMTNDQKNSRHFRLGYISIFVCKYLAYKLILETWK